MPVYNPTDANFLSVAQTRTNNGQKDVRVILDISTNIFYTLDDDGNFIEIQSSGGGQDLAGTLAIGNETQGTSISISNGDGIFGQEGGTFQIGIVDNSNNLNGITTYDNSGGAILLATAVADNNLGVKTLINQYTDKIELFSNTNGVEIDNEVTINSQSGTTIDVRNSDILIYGRGVNDVLLSSSPSPSFASGAYLRKGYGDLGQFKTTSNTPTTLATTLAIGGNVVYVEALVRGWQQTGATYKGLVRKMSAGFRKDSSGNLVQIGSTSTSLNVSDFSTATSSFTITTNKLNLVVTGEAATDIFWQADFTYYYA